MQQLAQSSRIDCINTAVGNLTLHKGVSTILFEQLDTRKSRMYTDRDPRQKLCLFISGIDKKEQLFQYKFDLFTGVLNIKTAEDQFYTNIDTRLIYVILSEDGLAEELLSISRQIQMQNWTV